MPVSINNTTLTFNDATTQTTAPVNTSANVNSVTLTGGTAISITSATTTGAAAATINNTGVTSVTAGTGISVSASTGGVTITNTSSASGTVTSVATGNGLQGGTITSSGTLSVACPAFNTVGSYCQVAIPLNYPSVQTISSGSNYSAGGGSGQFRSSGFWYIKSAPDGDITLTNNLSGTWKWMGGTQNYFDGGGNTARLGIACRVS
jgi:hypothetical protein